MRRTFNIFMISLLILSFSCETAQDGVNITEDTLDGTHALKGRNCMSVVMAEVLDCGVYRISSSKDLSNIVYRVDGVDTKIKPLEGKTFMLQVDDVTDIWVKSGCNQSGDGPGYGEHIAIDDSDFCDGEPQFEQCEIDADCQTGRCGEGGYCTGAVGGRVFIDANGDGIFNAGESGTVAGVYLQILVAVGWVDFGFEVTDAEGFYLFTSLNAYNGPNNPDGDFKYRIRLIAPPEAPTFVYTLQNVGDDDTIDSDMNPAEGFTDAVNPDPDEVISTLWVGVLPE